MNTWNGEVLRISIFGESHGNGLGCVVDGLPAGIRTDADKIRHELNLRRPRGGNTTSRKEDDDYEIVSGVSKDGVTCGTPLCVLFRNRDARKGDYNTRIPRPSHADFSAYVKYHGFCDLNGGGHFSARLTAPLVFLGAIARCELEKMGILSAVSIKSIGNAVGKSFYDTDFRDDIFINTDCEFPLIDASCRDDMLRELETAKEEKDSVGGTVEFCMKNLPVGLGEPFFSSVESSLAQLMFSIPAVKGVEFGRGFELAKMRGSCANDEFDPVGVEEKIKGMNKNAQITYTNNAGGINGGLTNSMPLIMRVAFKPIPSIGQGLQSVDMQSFEPVIVKTEGRHDVCAALRGAFAVRSSACICMYDFLLKHSQYERNSHGYSE
ncbi:MAG: chorismate synthase [Clostridia bacterium]|nr:chorismate synthase [Clostridia bacterium]